MKKIFRKDLYIKDILNEIIKKKEYKYLRGVLDSLGPDRWATKCDGKEVIDGMIGKYIIFDEWCEEVEEDEN